MATRAPRHALIHCPDCGAARRVSERYARSVRDQGHVSRCALCRREVPVHVTAELRTWAQTTWDGWTRAEQGAVAMALRSWNER